MSTPVPERERSGDLASAVNAIWEKFRGVTLDRVSALEDAAVALLGGDLDPETRRRAEREAHKLAGSVGTFGFSRGSELAREIELLLGGATPLDQAQVLRLSDLTVSLRAELQGTPRGAVPAASGRASVLVIDQDREFTERVAMEAEGRGLAVRVVERMSDVRGVLAAENPDVVLLDPAALGSPELGLWLLTEMTMRASARPVLVVSREAGFAPRVEAARLGAHAFLQKPVSPPAVVDALLHALHRPAASAHVLAVDDNPVTLATVQALLEASGFRVSTVDDPRDFWNALESAGPDLVILDVDMPHASGLELCRMIRNESRWSTLPVILLTARVDADTIREGFAAGADDFVSKPIVGPELTVRIENRLERARLYQLLADTDALTGVGNRRNSEESIKRLLALAARQKQPLALAAIDLDHFKRVNDRFGHAVGDDVLRRVSRRLRNALRGEDVIGRWGGEEFVIATFGVDRQVLQRRLSELLNGLRSEGIPVGEELLPLTFSAGVAEFPADGEDLATLYRAADAALAEAKSQGAERVLRTGWATAGAEGPQQVDVLLVEDDPVLAELLLHALSTHGYRHAWLRDGESAVESVSGPNPRIEARVVLLDVNLPGRDGLGVLQELSRSGVIHRTRVIMLTVRSSESEVVRSLALGAFDHVAKPFSVPVLLRRIHTALQQG